MIPDPSAPPPQSNFRRWVVIFVVILSFTNLIWRRPPAATENFIRISGQTMGTTYRVVVASPPSALVAERLQQQVDQLLEKINDQMSNYRPNSELSRFNSSDSIDWQPVSAELALVVAEAQQISRNTNGRFDATVGPLVILWNFGPNRHQDQVPSDDDINQELQRTGFQHIAVRTDPPALKKDQPDIELDLSAIAKGYGVDQVAELLLQQSDGAFLVEIGGEVRTSGHKPDGTAWKVGIESPLENRRDIQRAVPLSDVALATSGDYRNYFEQNGKRFSHTIDPSTGRPVSHQLASASVLSDRCMTADAIATSLMVMGPDEGYNWAVEQQLAALLIVRKPDGFVELPTPAWEKRFAQAQTVESK